MCRAAQGAFIWALGIRVRLGNSWMGCLHTAKKANPWAGMCFYVGLWICVEQKVDFPWLCVNPCTLAGCRGFADTPREMQLGEMIFVMCTHRHSICLQQGDHECGVRQGHPFLHTWAPSAVSPRACTCVNQHLSPVSIALYLPASCIPTLGSVLAIIDTVSH